MTTSASPARTPPSRCRGAAARRRPGRGRHRPGRKRSAWRWSPAASGDTILVHAKEAIAVVRRLGGGMTAAAAPAARPARAGRDGVALPVPVLRRQRPGRGDGRGAAVHGGQDRRDHRAAPRSCAARGRRAAGGLRRRTWPAGSPPAGGCSRSATAAAPPTRRRWPPLFLHPGDGTPRAARVRPGQRHRRGDRAVQRHRRGRGVRPADRGVRAAGGHRGRPVHQRQLREPAARLRRGQPARDAHHRDRRVQGGKMAELDSIDYLFVAPSTSVHRIQEAQTTIYHVLWELTAGGARRGRMTPMPRTLVACLGNIFLSDDGFGVEVARPAGPRGAAGRDDGDRLRDPGHAPGLRPGQGWDATILVDATARGEPPGPST